MSTSTDASVAATADRLVNGERGDDYGHPHDDFARTAKGWEMILGIPVTPMQVALCMIQVKVSRQCHRHKRDNLVDICGYALTGEKIMEREATPIEQLAEAVNDRPWRKDPTTKAPPKDMFGYGPPWCHCESPIRNANRACRRCGRSVADVTITYDIPKQPDEQLMDAVRAHLNNGCPDCQVARVFIETNGDVKCMGCNRRLVQRD